MEAPSLPLLSSDPLVPMRHPVPRPIRLTPISTIALPTLEGLEFLLTKDIRYCEAENNYCRIHLTGSRPILVSRPLKYVTDLLHTPHFFRVHKRFLIHLPYIRRYLKGEGGLVVLDNGTEIPVARGRKEAFLTWASNL